MKVTAADLKELGLIERIDSRGRTGKYRYFCTALQAIWTGL